MQYVYVLDDVIVLVVIVEDCFFDFQSIQKIDEIVVEIMDVVGVDCFGMVCEVVVVLIGGDCVKICVCEGGQLMVL